MRFLPTVAFCLACLVGSLRAQEASGVSRHQPTPPYLAPVPANLHWIVNFTYPSKDASGAPAAPPPATYPVTVETTKVGDLRRILVKFVNSPPRQFDISADNCFMQTPAGLECRKLDGNDAPYMFFNPGFAFTQCVNLASFKEASTYQNVPVFHYQKDSNEAWISVSTMLPIGADLMNTVQTSYQYLPTPVSGDVVLTPAEQKILLYRKLGAEIYKNMR